MNEIDVRQFRNALGSFVTGVTVITSRDAKGQPVALTVNSFTAVSLDPPLVLWNIHRESDFFAEFSQTDHYAVHILRQDQEDLSRHFSAEIDDKFGDIEFQTGIAALPLLSTYCARFQCKVEHRYDGGDHIILVGRVLDMDHKREDPLVFHAGKYKKLILSDSDK